MPRRIKDPKLDTRTARLKKPVRREPYWRALSQGRHIGYRRSAKGSGTWFARYYRSGEGYAFERLGIADDYQEADGVQVLGFQTAQDKAQKWFKEQARVDAGLSHKARYTVADAIEDYLDHYAVNGKWLQDIRYRVDAILLPQLGKIEVAKLTPARIRNWHRDLAVAPARLRTRPGEDQNYREPPSDEESKRKRRHSANKALTVLKAALNHAYREGYVRSDDAWRRVKPFACVDQPRIRFANSEAEKRALVSACDDEFRPLVQAALMTGARYAELGNLRVEDFDPSAGTVHIRTSKTGKPRHIVLSEDAVDFFAAQCRGRARSDLIFTHSDGRKWGKSHQQRPMLDACKAAGIDPPISFHILRHWYAASLVAAGVPITIVAENLGHSDPKITTRYYGHLSPAQQASIIRQRVRNLGIADVGGASV